jgi:hypothetical protein
MRHGRFIDFGKNGRTEQVYVFDDDLTRYVMKFDTLTSLIIISYYDYTQPMRDVRPIRKIIQQAYKGSAAHMAFNKVLNNNELKQQEAYFEYDQERYFVITNPMIKKDLSDVSNNLKKKGMPDDFRNFFFHSFGGSKVLRINTVVTQADINRLGLNVDAMNEYLSGLKDFEIIDEEAGWR